MYLKKLDVTQEFLTSPLEYSVYFELVAQYLSGYLTLNPTTLQKIQSLPADYQNLIQARLALRKNDFEDGAFLYLVELTKSTDLFARAEAYFVLGSAQDRKKDHSMSANFFKSAADMYYQLSMPAKGLLAEFNYAMELTYLGRHPEAYELEMKILHLSDELSVLNVKALCLRSLGYQNLRQQQWRLAMDFFDKAEKLFLSLKNNSDASLCFGYASLIRIKLQETEDIDTRRYSMTLNLRSQTFMTLIDALLAGRRIHHLMDRCMSDVQEAVALCSLIDWKFVSQVRSSSLSDKLLNYLRSSGGASEEECVEELWPKDQNYVSAQKRLWTLISRTNKRQRIIFLGPDKKYRLG